MDKPYTVVAWAEEFAGLFGFVTLAEARAFASGWSEGAGNYGAGKTTTYVLPDDQAELEASPKDLAEYTARRGK